MLARSGRPAETPRAVDLAALADSIAEEYPGKVIMEPGERVIATIRPGLVRRAIRNLIDNGLKYGSGEVRVAVHDLGEQAAIVIIDSGPGIAVVELEKVQDAFYRIEASRSRDTGGAGLGLALARAAAETHDGELKLENRPGGGLTATILLAKG